MTTYRPTEHLRNDGDFAGTALAGWVAATGYTAGDYVTNDTPTHVYRCMTTGTSAGSGGPTGTDRDNNVADNTCAWRYVGDTGSSVAAPPDGLRESGYPINAFVPSDWFNWFHQRADQWLKHFEESKAPGNGRRDNTASAPSVVDNGGGAGRVIAWSAFDCDLTTTLAGVSGSRRYRIAAGTLDLLTNDTHWVYVAASNQTVTSTTTAANVMSNGAPLARVVTAAGNITSIIPVNILPVAVDESGDGGPILVGPSVSNGRANTTDFIGACYHDLLRNAASLPVRGIKLVGNVEVSQAIAMATIFVGGTIDLNGFRLRGTHAGHLFECTGFQDFKMGGGILGLNNAGAGDYIHITNGGASTCYRWHLYDIEIPAGTGTDEGNKFISSDDVPIQDWVIERIRSQTQEAFAYLHSNNTYNSDIQRVTFRDCYWTADGAGVGNGLYVTRTAGTGVLKAITVDNCNIVGAAGSAIYFDDCVDSKVSNTHVEAWGNSQTGIAVLGGTGCNIHGCTLDGTGITTPDGIVVTCAGGAITGNTIHNIATGVNSGIKTTFASPAKAVAGNSLGGSDNDTDTGGGDISSGNA